MVVEVVEGWCGCSQVALPTATLGYLTAQINGMMCNRGGGGRQRGVDVDGEKEGSRLGKEWA